MNWLKLISTALIILGGYYFLAAVRIIQTEITFGSYMPGNRVLALIAIGLIIIGLLLNKDIRKRMSNAFS